MMSKILAIDDEPIILMLIKQTLEKDLHIVTTVAYPLDIDYNKLKEYDLILLDIMMPDINGFTLCEEIRDIVDCPIVFLTAKSVENDIMYGLSIGADDYIKKPFSVGELRARVNAHLRREKREKKNLLYISGLKFDLAGKEIFVGDEKIKFTKSEYEICTFLMKNRGQVFSREQIYVNIYGYGGASDSSTISEHIKNIRFKLKLFNREPIETVWGIGYKWVKNREL